MAITSDWHIHTKCSCDSACMEFETLVADAKRLGITDFGVSDHYHTRIQEPDIAASRKEYEAIIKKHPELSGHFHFGIEATIVSEWEVGKIARKEYSELPIYGFRDGGPAGAPILFDFDEEFLEKYKIDYVIAGMHWPMYCDLDKETMIKEYHRQYMFAATHPFTKIMAHYLWVDQYYFKYTRNVPDYENPFLDFAKLSSGMKSELKSALLENDVAFELNGWLFEEDLPEKFINPYFEWMAELQESGIKIAMGSDCHKPTLLGNYKEIDEFCKKFGIKTDEFFCLGK